MNYLGILGAYSLSLAAAPCLGAQSSGGTELFREAGPLGIISGGTKETTFFPVITDTYAPSDIPLSIGPHPRQKLTVFRPGTPVPPEGYPVLVFSPADAFKEGVIIPAPIHALFVQALLEGWAVVTVGTTGVNSTPVGTQPSPCNGVPGANCWDYGMWYPPDDVVMSPWNDFSYFYGEKDFVWARQRISLMHESWLLDDDRVFVTGASTGAIYAQFLAYEAQPWKQSNFPTGPTLSTQVKLPIAVAGVISFETVSWLGGEQPQGPKVTAGTVCTWEGLAGNHWPLASDPSASLQLYRTRSFRMNQIGAGLAGQSLPPPLYSGGPQVTSNGVEIMRSNSSSAWVRDNAPLVPTYIAGGDGMLVPFILSNFNRSAQANPGTYARLTADDPTTGLLAGDPSEILPDVPPMAVHDLFHALILKEDLESVGPVFHRRHSQLALLDGLKNPMSPAPFGATRWGFVDKRFSPNMMTVPTSAADIPIIDDTFSFACGRPACTPYDNADAYPRILRWAEFESLYSRQSNIDAYTDAARHNYNLFRMQATDLVDLIPFGSELYGTSTWTVTVDLNFAEDRYDAAGFIAYVDGIKVDLTLNNGEHLLAVDAGSGNILEEVGVVPADANRFVILTGPVDALPLGHRVTVQACLYDYAPVFTPGFALTNAVDLTLQ